MRYYRLTNGRLTTSRMRAESELARLARRTPHGYADAKIYEGNALSPRTLAAELLNQLLPLNKSPDDERLIPLEVPRWNEKREELFKAAVHALGDYIESAFAEVAPRDTDQDPVALLRAWSIAKKRPPAGKACCSEEVPLDDEGPEDDEEDAQ